MNLENQPDRRGHVGVIQAIPENVAFVLIRRALVLPTIDLFEGAKSRGDGFRPGRVCFGLIVWHSLLEAYVNITIIIIYQFI